MCLFMCRFCVCVFVTQYGGDVTRKQKLLKAQAEGKKRMRAVGNVRIPKEAFINIMRK